ncbi:Secreted Ly-6/uPAR-related protein 1 [Galemys pyrenaicus]|uniref:Secreted Ly-6/uPAR-related protein 1 n=1 Tax=Galemys pyrenaicus TaxID=202257 RepID=A0A8J6APF9_GALPY|nr:Secreted Ly-6/uPAR-related protein 1 [Galemys pyrenaicus]
MAALRALLLLAAASGLRPGERWSLRGLVPQQWAPTGARHLLSPRAQPLGPGAGLALGWASPSQEARRSGVRTPRAGPWGPGEALGWGTPGPADVPPAGPGGAFRCFTCEQPTPVASCTNVTRCAPAHTACRTTLAAGWPEYPFHQSPLVTRSCASSCVATDPDSLGGAHLVHCCFQDLCNSAGATALGAGALATLGAVLLGRLFP